MTLGEIYGSITPAALRGNNQIIIIETAQKDDILLQKFILLATKRKSYLKKFLQIK